MKRIFIVEDALTFQATLRDMLEAVGGFAVVGSVSNETAATEWLQQNAGRWEIAIIDIVLGEGSGLNIVRRCRNDNPSGTIIVFSEFVSPAVEAHCLGQGADVAFKKTQLSQFLAFIKGAENEVVPPAEAGQ